MFFEFLDKLRAKPEHVRKHIALLTTLAIFFVIVNIWWETKRPSSADNTVKLSDVVSPVQLVANAFISAKDTMVKLGSDYTGVMRTATSADSIPDVKHFSPRSSREDVVYPYQIYTDKGAPSGGEKLRATTTTTASN